MKSETLSTENQRIREVFGHRQEIGDGQLDMFRILVHQERQEILLSFFRHIGLASLKGLRILDVGCGSGGLLRQLVEYGSEPAKCVGIDLYRPTLAGGRKLNADLGLIEASAGQLPFAGEQFNLVFQFTVFTSVLDKEIRQKMAAEIKRVLRPGGYLVWYDFAYSNPQNSNVRGIGRAEIRALFGDFHLRFRRVTLAPPLGRRAARISPLLFRALGAIPLLRSHYFCFARKPGALV